jgi:peptidoglycan/LPS O-acetylase OafA/YrhL
MLFYVIFGMTIASAQLGKALFCAWATLISLQMLGFVEVGWIAGGYCIQFLFGLVAAHIVLTRPSTRPERWLTLGMAGFAIVLVVETAGSLNGRADVARLLYGLPAAAMLAGAAMLEQQRRLRVPRVLLWLGAISYSLYLCHTAALGIALRISAKLGLPHPLVPVACITVAIVAAITLHLVVERPSLRYLRARWQPTGRPQLASPERA